MRPSPLRPLLLVLVLTAIALAPTCLLGCARPATAAELQEWGTRTYAGTSRSAAFKATWAAVRSLGYDVAAVNPGAGQLHTAPKVVAVTVVGNQYAAQAAESSIAWDLDVTTSAAGIVIHATPRGYQAGQAMPQSQMSASYLQRAFETLFSEIERDMGVVGTSAPAQAAAAPAASGH
jgi:hypothetical protein